MNEPDIFKYGSRPASGKVAYRCSQRDSDHTSHWSSGGWERVALIGPPHKIARTVTSQAHAEGSVVDWRRLPSPRLLANLFAHVYRSIRERVTLNGYV
jgi:hypothetical protein